MVDPTSLPLEFADSRQRAIWVMGELKYAGSSLNKIAAENGWNRSAVYRALHVPSFPQEQAIARALGYSVEALLPERYDADGNRLHRVRPSDQCRHVDTTGNAEAREAA